MKNGNKTQSSPRAASSVHSQWELQGVRAKGSTGSMGIPMEGWGDTGTAFGGGAAPLPTPAHLVASFVDRGRGTLAQEVLGAPQVVWGALHLQRCRCGGKHTGHLCQPRQQTPVFICPRLAVPGVKQQRRTFPLAGYAGLLPRQRQAGSTRRRAAHGRRCRRCQGHPVAGRCRCWRRNTDRCKNSKPTPPKNQKNEQTNAELQGGERHLPTARTETDGIAKPARQASLRLEEEMLQLPAREKTFQSCNCPQESWARRQGHNGLWEQRTGLSRDRHGVGRWEAKEPQDLHPGSVFSLRLPCRALHTHGAKMRVCTLKNCKRRYALKIKCTGKKDTLQISDFQCWALAAPSHLGLCLP